MELFQKFITFGDAALPLQTLEKHNTSIAITVSQCHSVTVTVRVTVSQTVIKVGATPIFARLAVEKPYTLSLGAFEDFTACMLDLSTFLQNYPCKNFTRDGTKSCYTNIQIGSREKVSMTECFPRLIFPFPIFPISRACFPKTIKNTVRRTFSGVEAWMDNYQLMNAPVNESLEKI